MRLSYLTAALGAVLATGAAAQQPAAPAPPLPPQTPAVPPLEVGAPAPDFTMSGATRYGVLRDSIHLSDFKGKTVVLAFFFRARTRG